MLLTPIEQYGDWFFKRDDKHHVIDQANGSKARMIHDTIEYFLPKIQSEYQNTVKTKNQQNTHTFYNMEAICKKFGVKYVNYTDTDSYNQSKFYPMQQRMKSTDFFYYDSTIAQVENIPANLDNLVVSCGSCQTLYAIMQGLIKFNNKPRYLIAVCNKAINPICEPYISHFNFYQYDRTQFQYDVIDSPFDMDTIHELKCWSFVNQKVKLSGSKLMWITGNYNFLRK